MTDSDNIPTVDTIDTVDVVDVVDTATASCYNTITCTHANKSINFTILKRR
jgi:hypothetical protein